MDDNQSADASFTVFRNDPAFRTSPGGRPLAPDELPVRFQIVFLFVIWIFWLTTLSGVYYRAYRLAERERWMESFAFGIVEFFMPLVLVVATGLCIGRRVLFADASIGFRLLSTLVLFMEIVGVVMLYFHCFDLPGYFTVVRE